MTLDETIILSAAKDKLNELWPKPRKKLDSPLLVYVTIQHEGQSVSAVWHRFSDEFTVRILEN